MINFLRQTTLACGLAATLGVSATHAQTTTGNAQGSSVPQSPVFGGGRHGGGKQGFERHALRRLDLNDTQRQQLRAIEQRYAGDFKSQHQELRQLMEQRRQGTTLTPEQEARAQALRAEFRDRAEKMRAEMQAILTPEQRDQLKQSREQFKQRREQRRAAREAAPAPQH